MRHDDWTQLVPLFQSALNNAPSPQRNNVPPVTAFTGLPATPPVSTFLRSPDLHAVSLADAQIESTFNIQQLVKIMDNLHPRIHAHVMAQRQRMRASKSRGELANFTEGDYVLVAREEFFEGEKLCLRWRGPRRVLTALNDYIFRVEDLRNGNCEDIHGTRLKFYADADLDKEAIMSHVLSSETGMPVSRLLRIVEQDRKLYNWVRWKGLTTNDDTMEPLECVYEDVPKLTLKLLDGKSTPTNIRAKARAALGL